MPFRHGKSVVCHPSPLHVHDEQSLTPFFHHWAQLSLRILLHRSQTVESAFLGSRDLTIQTPNLAPSWRIPPMCTLFPHGKKSHFQLSWSRHEFIKGVRGLAQWLSAHLTCVRPWVPLQHSNNHHQRLKFSSSVEICLRKGASPPILNL